MIVMHISCLRLFSVLKVKEERNSVVASAFSMKNHS